MGVVAVISAVGAAIGAGSFVATPLLSMSRRGTIDQQTKASWREEAAQAEQAARASAVSRARRRAAVVASIPAPRSGAHDQRRSPLAG